MRQTPMTDPCQRQGVLVKPQPRLSDEQVALVDGASRDLLQDPGLLCEHAETIDLFKAAGATVDTASDGTHVRIPPRLIDEVPSDTKRLIQFVNIACVPALFALIGLGMWFRRRRRRDGLRWED